MSANKSMTIAVASVAAILALLVLSPLMLIGIAKIYDVDWSLLSSVGQSFTGIGTVISGVGLIAVGLTLWVQIRQTRITQLQASRDLHFRILALPLDDKSLVAPYGLGNVDDATYAGFRKRLTSNLVMRYLEYCYCTDTIGVNDLKKTLREEVFYTDEVRAWWDAAGPWWRTAAVEKDSKEFVAIVDEIRREF